MIADQYAKVAGYGRNFEPDYPNYFIDSQGGTDFGQTRFYGASLRQQIQSNFTSKFGDPPVQPAAMTELANGPGSRLGVGNDADTIDNISRNQSPEVNNINDAVASEIETPQAETTAGASVPIAETVGSTVEAAAEASGVAEAETVAEGAGIFESLAGPEAIALQMGQLAGSAISSGMDSRIQSGITQQYNQNVMHGSGMNLVQNASIIAAQQQKNASYLSTGGALGSIFGGPVGMLLGRAIGSTSQESLNSNSLNTTFAAGGRINPQSNDIPDTDTALGTSFIGGQALATSQSMDTDATVTTF